MTIGRRLNSAFDRYKVEDDILCIWAKGVRHIDKDSEMPYCHSGIFKAHLPAESAPD